MKFLHQVNLYTRFMYKHGWVLFCVVVGVKMYCIFLVVMIYRLLTNNMHQSGKCILQTLVVHPSYVPARVGVSKVIFP
jgi:hypothetical protein